MKKIINIFAALIILAVMASFAGQSKLTVTSRAFKNNGAIPLKYSCEGDGISPPLQIAGVPTEAKSLALIVHDPDAPVPGGMTHWVMWNLDVSGNIPEDFEQGAQGMNGKKEVGYMGMCPPSGTHHYHFKAFALDQTLNLDENTGEAGLKKAMQGHILAQGELVGLYSKQ